MQNSLFDHQSKHIRYISYVILIFLFSRIFAVYFLFDRRVQGGFESAVDFDAFYLVGKMYWQGIVDKAYYFVDFKQQYVDVYGVSSFMPWTYPPPFNILTALLASFKHSLSYLFFVLISCCSFLFFLYKITRDFFHLTVVFVFPAIAVNIICGQNGLLTASLIGLFCWLWLRGRVWAGVPLGLMIIKPHLAIGFALLLLLKREWKIILVAGVTSALCVLLSSLVMGWDIWAAFLNGVKESKFFLSQGVYPIHRMNSFYAFFLSFGVPADWAIILHALIAISACGFIALLVYKNWNLRRLLGVTAFATLFISPYMYDYDHTILGLGVGLLMPDIVRYVKEGTKIYLLTCLFFGTLSGLVFYSQSETRVYMESLVGKGYYAVMGVFLLCALIIVLRAVHQGHKEQPASIT